MLLLPKTFIPAFCLVYLGAAAAIPKAIDASVESTQFKREVDNNGYTLTKRGNDDSLYKKDGLYKKGENEDSLERKDSLYDSVYKRNSLYEILHKKREDENRLYKKDGAYKKAEDEDSLYKRDSLYGKAKNADSVYRH
ncbi:hypothetical protein HO133_009616 [Letharia lupina]|uniref:Uncharacterized protein n=1 Tax=Letharia lupina TaxID=560253 RepID=A0A8H6CM17_9LECA|nr:uncharacterized protein HO133_009616 [Letharia lupina]KAF6225616.1 hypothetical protein HO133_009616 [Letharia lupina]